MEELIRLRNDRESLTDVRKETTLPIEEIVDEKKLVKTEEQTPMNDDEILEMKMFEIEKMIPHKYIDSLQDRRYTRLYMIQEVDENNLDIQIKTCEEIRDVQWVPVDQINWNNKVIAHLKSYFLIFIIVHRTKNMDSGRTRTELNNRIDLHELNNISGRIKKQFNNDTESPFQMESPIEISENAEHQKLPTVTEIEKRRSNSHL
ncbi:unnamed protein product, partial [Trichogramma brassicae]